MVLSVLLNLRTVHSGLSIPVLQERWQRAWPGDSECPVKRSTHLLGVALSEARDLGSWPASCPRAALEGMGGVVMGI